MTMEIWGVYIAVLLLAGYSSLAGRLGRTERKIARVERRLDLIIGHFGIQEDSSSFPEVAELLRDGKKIKAIKAYREATGADLVEAKNAVERML
ncbi:ribosomal protein L7/L12 [Streptomyces sp. NPDC007084]|uniref:ribosomal protein L7/L12 n=1 Tax=Streptomyces sp. NPDC007084 TaxID=3154313 RepID=UPI0034571CE7